MRKMVMLVFAGLVGAAAAGMAAGAAGGELRVALVIGNDSYEELPQLTNAGHDARAIAHKLTTLGFATTLKLNVTRSDLQGALDQFEAVLTDSDVGLVYYAGHGIQAPDESNYLLPVDARVESEAALVWTRRRYPPRSPP